MLTEESTHPVVVGDTAFDHLSTAVAHTQSAQFFVIQGDRDAVARWIDEAVADLEAARAAILTSVRELRRPTDVTETLMERDL